MAAIKVRCLGLLGNPSKPELPGALRRILAICGDGGFLMNVQEMETARRLGCNFVTMVWEDGGYGLIAWKQDNEFKRHTDLSFGNPDWLRLAEAFGWRVPFLNAAAYCAAAALAILATTGKPFGAYANGFEMITEGFLQDKPTVDALRVRRDFTPENYVDHVMGWVDAGATIVGGCCEVGPAHIAEIARRLKDAGHTIV